MPSGIENAQQKPKKQDHERKDCEFCGNDIRYYHLGKGTKLFNVEHPPMLYFCSKLCKLCWIFQKQENKTNKGKKWLSKDVQELIAGMRITPDKLLEKDVKARKEANNRGDQRRRGIY